MKTTAMIYFCLLTVTVSRQSLIAGKLLSRFPDKWKSKGCHDVSAAETGQDSNLHPRWT